MAGSREPTRPKTSYYRILGDLTETRGATEAFGDVPLKLTEERLRAEQERGATGRQLQSASLARHGTAPEAGAACGDWILAGGISHTPGPPSGAPLPATGDQPLRNPPRSGPEAQPRQRAPGKARRIGRAPRMAILMLAVTLGGFAGYGYLALRADAVNVSRLPGAATVRAVRVETQNAWSDLQRVKQSGFAVEAGALKNQAGSALTLALSRSKELASELSQRYKQWRARD